MNARSKMIIRYALAAVLIAFGALTLFLSGSVILDLFDMRAKEGNYVDFVVWANFLASLLYIASAFGLLTRRNWSATPLLIALSMLIVTAVGFAIHVSGGGLHEQRTIGALAFRTGLTAVFLLLSTGYEQNKNNINPTNMKIQFTLTAFALVLFTIGCNNATRETADAGQQHTDSFQQVEHDHADGDQENLESKSEIPKVVLDYGKTMDRQ